MGFKCSNPKQLGNEEYNKKLLIELYNFFILFFIIVQSKGSTDAIFNKSWEWFKLRTLICRSVSVVYSSQQQHFSI